MTKNYCAFVVNNMIAQIIVADIEWASQNLAGDWCDLGPEPLTVGIGYIWNGQGFVAPVVDGETQ